MGGGGKATFGGRAGPLWPLSSKKEYAKTRDILSAEVLSTPLVAGV